jgi:hypothetical protein
MVSIDHFGPREVEIQIERYDANDRLCVDLHCDGELYTTLSVNLPEYPLADDEFIFKTYSGNEGLLEQMIAAGIVETTGRFAIVGMAGLQPVCRLIAEAEPDETEC